MWENVFHEWCVTALSDTTGINHRGSMNAGCYDKVELLQNFISVQKQKSMKWNSIYLYIYYIIFGWLLHTHSLILTCPFVHKTKTVETRHIWAVSYFIFKRIKLRIIFTYTWGIHHELLIFWLRIKTTYLFIKVLFSRWSVWNKSFKTKNISKYRITFFIILNLHMLPCGTFLYQQNNKCLVKYELINNKVLVSGVLNPPDNCELSSCFFLQPPWDS